MDNVGKPKITKTKKKDKDFTRVTFTPDYERFGMDGLDADHEALMCKRVYDMAGTTPKDVRVYLNGVRIAVSGTLLLSISTFACVSCHFFFKNSFTG